MLLARTVIRPVIVGALVGLCTTLLQLALPVG